MNLYAESSMMGFLNLFTGVQAPRLVTCEKRAKATVVNRQLVLAAVKTNSQFLLEFSAYCEIAALERVIYVSRASLDRLLAAASKSGMILLQGGERFVRRRDIAAMTEWILER